MLFFQVNVILVPLGTGNKEREYRPNISSMKATLLMSVTYPRKVNKQLPLLSVKEMLFKLQGLNTLKILF